MSAIGMRVQVMRSARAIGSKVRRRKEKGEAWQAGHSRTALN